MVWTCQLPSHHTCVLLLPIPLSAPSFGASDAVYPCCQGGWGCEVKHSVRSSPACSVYSATVSWHFCCLQCYFHVNSWPPPFSDSRAAQVRTGLPCQQHSYTTQLPISVGTKCALEIHWVVVEQLCGVWQRMVFVREVLIHIVWPIQATGKRL